MGWVPYPSIEHVRVITGLEPRPDVAVVYWDAEASLMPDESLLRPGDLLYVRPIGG